mmetsp:Transcript_11274/g.22850  ORF Transcript_11274/g.22850 Transcript_11274/m.22850 type:complete len:238 (-) Transcript_11274:1989-2702(-)
MASESHMATSHFLGGFVSSLTSARSLSLTRPNFLRMFHLLSLSGNSTILLYEPSFLLMILTLSSSLALLFPAVTTKALGIPVSQQVVSYMLFLSSTAEVSPRTTGRASPLSGMTNERNSLRDTVPSPLESKASMRRLNSSFCILRPKFVKTCFISMWFSSILSMASSFERALLVLRFSLMMACRCSPSTEFGSVEARCLSSARVSHLKYFLLHWLSKIFLKLSPGRSSLRNVSLTPE